MRTILYWFMFIPVALASFFQLVNWLAAYVFDSLALHMDFGPEINNLAFYLGSPLVPFLEGDIRFYADTIVTWLLSVLAFHRCYVCIHFTTLRPPHAFRKASVGIAWVAFGFFSLGLLMVVITMLVRHADVHSAILAGDLPFTAVIFILPLLFMATELTSLSAYFRRDTPKHVESK